MNFFIFTRLIILFSIRDAPSLHRNQYRPKDGVVCKINFFETIDDRFPPTRYCVACEAGYENKFPANRTYCVKATKQENTSTSTPETTKGSSTTPIPPLQSPTPEPNNTTMKPSSALTPNSSTDTETTAPAEETSTPENKKNTVEGSTSPALYHNHHLGVIIAIVCGMLIVQVIIGAVIYYCHREDKKIDYAQGVCLSNTNPPVQV